MAPTPARLGVQRQHRFGGLDPVPQQSLLEADDGGQHRLALDFGGRDDNAAVHEVGHGVRQLARTLCLEHCLIEHLGRTEISDWTFVISFSLVSLAELTLSAISAAIALPVSR